MQKLSILLICALVVLGGGALAQLATDMKLEDAGFVMRKADTAEKILHIKRVPPRQFVSRVKNGKTYYVYADPAVCQCVFVGDAIAYEAYRDMRKRLPQPDAVAGSGVNATNIVASEMDRDVSDVIDDGNILDWKF
jgi:hypothetical protein